MKKRAAYFVIIMIGTMFLASCAGMPPYGVLYNETYSPEYRQQAPLNSEMHSKVGTGMIQCYLGLISTGDASIETAMKNGKITKIHHVDYKAKNILGLYTEYTIYVYGE